MQLVHTLTRCVVFSRFNVRREGAGCTGVLTRAPTALLSVRFSVDGKYLAMGCVYTMQPYDTNMSFPAGLRSTPLRTQPRPSDNPRGPLHFTLELRQKSHRPARPATAPARQLDASIKKSAGSTETDLDDKLSRFGRVEQVVIA